MPLMRQRHASADAAARLMLDATLDAADAAACHADSSPQRYAMRHYYDYAMLDCRCRCRHAYFSADACHYFRRFVASLFMMPLRRRRPRHAAVIATRAMIAS